MNAPAPRSTFSDARTVRPEPAIRFEGVSKLFPARGAGPAVAALDGIDSAVAAGSILGVIGRSGAGKSTLIPPAPRVVQRHDD